MAQNGDISFTVFNNGLIIAFSGLMAETYRTWKKKLHINDKAAGYHVFCVVRTFLLVEYQLVF